MTGSSAPKAALSESMARKPEQDRMYPVLHLIAHCGLRRGEACGLHWEETNLSTGAITISHQITQVGARTSPAVSAMLRLDDPEEGPHVAALRS